MTLVKALRTTTARSVSDFLADQRGTTAIEYGLLISLIGMAILATVMTVGQGIKQTLYQAIVNALMTIGK